MPHSRYTTEEIGRRGLELYEQKLRPKVEAGNEGKYLAIDIETEDYELGDDFTGVIDRMHARHPDPALFTMRIGFPATARMRSSVTSSSTEQRFFGMVTLVSSRFTKPMVVLSSECQCSTGAA